MKETVFQSPQLGKIISEIIEREQLVRYLHEEAHMGLLHQPFVNRVGGIAEVHTNLVQFP